MFGKVWVSEAQTWVSCCVTVKNIQRRIFLAKRDFFTNTKSGEVNEEKPVTGMDLYNEFNDKVGGQKEFDYQTFTNSFSDRQAVQDPGAQVSASGENVRVRAQRHP